MNKIEAAYLDVPKEFKIACESFGIMVPDFLQLILRKFSLLYVFMGDDSEYNLATKAFTHAEVAFLKDQSHLKTSYSLKEYGNEAAPYFKKLIKLAVNRNYSSRMKREKARKLVDKLYTLVSKEIKFKPHLYLDEETKLTLSKDFLLMSAIHQYSPTVLVNALMHCVSLADIYARMHLDQIVPNPASGFYLHARGEYADLMDEVHINTLGFKDFILDLQEFDIRYFYVRDLEKRTAVYRRRLEEVFEEKINQYYDGE